MIDYLSGPRPYATGVSLYERFGTNPVLKRAFQTRPESRLLRITLIEELRKLSGVSVKELERIPRRAASVLQADITPPAQPTPAPGGNTPVPPAEVKRIRFRERFPFLSSPDCPDILKILVNDMFASFDAYREAHRRLAALSPDTPPETAAPLAATAVEEMLNDRAVWNELEHYREHGRPLGEHPKVKEAERWREYREMSDLDLLRTSKNAASNLSKMKAKISKDTGEEERRKHREALRRWETVKEFCEDEIERRRKGERYGRD